MTKTSRTLALALALLGCSTTAPKPAEEVRNEPAKTQDAAPTPPPPTTSSTPPATDQAAAPSHEPTTEVREPHQLMKATPSEKTTSGGGPGEAAKFSIYMLALTWAPNFCLTHSEKQQCQTMPGSFAADHLTIHGLWPNYNDKEAAQQGHPYPDFCPPYNVCKKEEPEMCLPDHASIPPKMKTYGPGYVTDKYFLADHEWPKHGSCTGLTSQVYFQEAVDTLLALPGDQGTPAKLAGTIGKTIKATDLRDSFEHPESVVLSCDDKCNLSQVGICLANGSDGQPKGRIACPKNVTTAKYDNGCFVKNRCKNITVQAAATPATPTPKPAPSESQDDKCSHPGQGPACKDDATCKKDGYLRCANSGCCTKQPK
jgi:ribonuclease T2